MKHNENVTVPENSYQNKHLHLPIESSAGDSGKVARAAPYR